MIQFFALFTRTLWATQTHLTEQGLLLSNCHFVTVYTRVNPRQPVCLHLSVCDVLALLELQRNTHCNTQLQITTHSTNLHLVKPGAPSSCLFSKWKCTSEQQQQKQKLAFYQFGREREQEREDGRISGILCSMY